MIPVVSQAGSIYTHELFDCRDYAGANKISASLRCDGINDCGDWSDEMGCSCDGEALYKCTGRPSR